jgi:hypothetical protein
MCLLPYSNTPQDSAPDCYFYVLLVLWVSILVRFRAVLSSIQDLQVFICVFGTTACALNNHFRHIRHLTGSWAKRFHHCPAQVRLGHFCTQIGIFRGSKIPQIMQLKDEGATPFATDNPLQWDQIKHL